MEVTTSIPVIITCLVVFAACVVAEVKWKLPLGITAMASAFVIGYFGLKLAPMKVIGFFPTNTVVPMILAMAFFAVFDLTGASKVLSDFMLSKIKGRTRYLPWVVLVIVSIVYMFASGAQYAVIPLVYALFSRSGIHPLMMVSTVYLPTLCGGLNPFVGANASNRAAHMAQYGITNPVGVGTGAWIGIIFCALTIQLVVWIITGTYKIPDANIQIEGGDKRLEVTPVHKKALGLLGFVVALFLVPAVLNIILANDFTKTLTTVISNYTIFPVCIVIAQLMKLCNFNDMIRRVNMRMVLMIGGVTCLIQVMTQAGVMPLVQGLIDVVPQWMIAPILIIVFSTLSLFVTGASLSPIMYPLAIALAISQVEGITYISCVLMAVAAAGCSPVSGAGAMILSIVPPEASGTFTKNQIKLAAINVAIIATLAALGVIGMVVSPFAAQYY